ncbi:MAG: NusG domain II-containing protein [bacterium]|nr:MAG: NusG domain II-containing protein [bacterium]
MEVKTRPRITDGALLVLLAVFTAVSPRLLPAGAVGDRVLVQAGGKEWGVPLLEDGRREVPGPLGPAVLVVESGSARLQNAPCPLKICERMGPIRRAGEVIVCLPNRIVVKVPGREVVDAVTR